MRWISIPALLTIFAIAGCFPGGIEEPEDGTEPDFDLTGAWNYGASLLGGEGSCEITGVTITIVQSGNDLTGSTHGGTAECTVGGVHRFDPLPDMPVRDGRIFQTQMIMSFGEGQTWRHAGTVFGDLVRGTSDLTRDFGGEVGVVTLEGSWSAGRER